MPKFSLELAFATLIPDFIYQFFSASQVNGGSLTCLELEDLGDSIRSANGRELDGMKQFLAIDDRGGVKSGDENSEDSLTETEKLELMSGRLDAELEEVDSELYHRYTPGELKYIFGEIVDNIDRVYALFKENTGLNMAFSIGFSFSNGLESSLVIEFLHIDDTPEPPGDVLFVPMKDYLVSDRILARAYFLYEDRKQAEYDGLFQDIAGMLQMKSGSAENGLHEEEGHRHGPGCGHMH